MLGSQEIKDVLGPLISEEREKRLEHKNIKDRVDRMVLAFFSERYGLSEGDVVLEVSTHSRLRFEKFIADMGDDESGVGFLEKRPFVMARPIHPFGLGKPKKYYPADWITEKELEEVG